MNSAGWSFWWLTAKPMSQTLRPSPSGLRTGSALGRPTSVLTAATVVLTWPPLVGIRWLTEPTRRPDTELNRVSYGKANETPPP